MGISDSFDSIKNIATNSVARSGDIVESAGDLLKGDIKGGATKMASSITDIATTAATEGISAAGSAAGAVGEVMKKATGQGDDAPDSGSSQDRSADTPPAS
ncbi:MAG: hypothetical protein QM809_11975 [Gordonia sp. (in: high G+C Gram-positive bacteria)]|uniref:Rv1893 family protein n=1 Tax=Gordonia sp. (in: high G+C Gram-positive bacteria) TaxID=84139 RepID=UPI0039E69174